MCCEDRNLVSVSGGKGGLLELFWWLALGY